MNDYRVVAIDDGYFPPQKKGRTTLAGVLWGSRKIRITMDYVDIDGKDATGKAIGILEALESCRKGTIVMLDGVAYAGFNYINPEVVADMCNNDFIVIFYRPLNIEKIRNALLKNFSDWEERLENFNRAFENTRTFYTKRGKIYVYTNVEYTFAHNILNETQIYSPIPEPLRLAHFIASESSLFLRRQKLF